MAILITGGTGFIGSHTVVELLNIGEEVIIVDNLCNSKLCVLDRIEAITGKRPIFYKVDLLDRAALAEVFEKHKNIDSVIHFAGLKAVGESVSMPLHYYHNNLTGTFNLCEEMIAHGIMRIVFRPRRRFTGCLRAFRSRRISRFRPQIRMAKPS